MVPQFLAGAAIGLAVGLAAQQKKKKRKLPSASGVGAAPARWHYIDRWAWIGGRWVRQEVPGHGNFYFEYSHPMDALNVHDTARFPNGASTIARCFFYDGAGWQPCEWA